MKKIIFICSFFYSLCALARSYVEPVYFVNEKNAPCVYQTEQRNKKDCKTCDSPEVFEVIPVVNLEGVFFDEIVCPQREVVCQKIGTKSVCWSKLKEKTK